MNRAAASQNFKLPYDILLHIFAFHVQNLLESASPSEWLSFTHVCRCWRAVALESPSLWTTPDFRFPTIALNVLERAKTLPLFLKMNTCEYNSDGYTFEEFVVRVLDRHLPRTASLELRCPSIHGLRKIFLDAIETPSLLHSLRLSVLYQGDDGGTMSLYDIFVGNTTPNLRRLAFDNCAMPWGSPSLKHLTHLEVVASSDPFPELSISRFTGILRDCPVLEVLRMWSCLSRTRDDIVSVELPRLRLLFINDKMSVLLEIMTKIQLPNSTRIDLGCLIADDQISSADVARIVELALRSSVRRVPAKEISCLSFEWDCLSSVSTFVAFRDISPAEPSPFFSLQLPVPPIATADLVHHTDAFIRAASPPTSHSASLSALKTLRVKDVVLSSPTVRLLSKLNGVQALDLSTSQTLTPFLEELGQSLGTEERFPFPSLVLLNLRNFAFGLNPPDIPNELKIRMLESLSARINRGRGIMALTLESCEGFLVEEIDMIREIVPGFEQV